MEREILNWMANGDTGVSSRAMAFCAVDICNDRSTFGSSAPSDPDDFNRCLKLVIEIPEIKEHFGKISELNAGWSLIIPRWDEVEKSFLDEVGIDWCKSSSGPKTYKLMKDIYANKQDA